MIKLNSIEEFDRAVVNAEMIFLLKHSTTCPISAAAYVAYEKFTDQHHEIPAYFLTVQDTRSISNNIAERYEIKHESPQAILFSKNDVVWYASHWEITDKSLTETLAENK